MAFTPVIIGVADVKNQSKVHKEPATLMFEAISHAIHDTGLASLAPVISQIDSIDVVRTWTWPYADLPGLLGKWLGLDERPAWTRYTEHGGNEPARLVDEAAGRIARGETKVAVVTGGEALASGEYGWWQLRCGPRTRGLPPVGESRLCVRRDARHGIR